MRCRCRFTGESASAPERNHDAFAKLRDIAGSLLDTYNNSLAGRPQSCRRDAGAPPHPARRHGRRARRAGLRPRPNPAFDAKSSRRMAWNCPAQRRARLMSTIRSSSPRFLDQGSRSSPTCRPRSPPFVRPKRRSMRVRPHRKRRHSAAPKPPRRIESCRRAPRLVRTCARTGARTQAVRPRREASSKHPLLDAPTAASSRSPEIEPEIAPRDGLHHGGTVTLFGKVFGESEKSLAEETVRNIPGVTAVVDTITTDESRMGRRSKTESRSNSPMRASARSRSKLSGTTLFSMAK